MTKEYCMDCGVLLSPQTRICPVCGFDNRLPEHQWDVPMNENNLTYPVEDFIPENYPGY